MFRSFLRYYSQFRDQHRRVCILWLLKPNFRHHSKFLNPHKQFCFFSCSSLTSVTIPSTVTEIGNFAFYNCTGLVRLTVLRGMPPACEKSTFSQVSRYSCTLYVPDYSISRYKNTKYWEEFYDIKAVEATDVSQPEYKRTSTVVRRYDSNGRLMDKPVKGLNILKMSDGSTRKVIVK